MKPPRHLLWLFATCSLVSPTLLVAQAKAPETTTPQFSVARTGCTWKISDENNTVYLAGSVHLLREQDYPLPKVLDLAYENSDELVFELDMAELTQPEGILKMQQLGMLPAGENLSDRYSKKVWKKLTRYFSDSGLPVAILERLTPGMAFLSVSSIEAMKLGAKPELGVETQFYQRSVIDAKPSSGLETAEFQMSRFDELTDAQHDKLLGETLDRVDELAETIDQIIGAWHKGDVEGLDSLLNEQMEDGDPLRDIILIERNKNWIPQIEKAISGKDNVMFIVGAAHLIGEDSVIDLLEKRGHQPELVEEVSEVALVE